MVVGGPKGTDSTGSESEPNLPKGGCIHRFCYVFLFLTFSWLLLNVLFYFHSCCHYHLILHGYTVTCYIVDSEDLMTDVEKTVLAKCLAKKRITLHGTTWCGWCRRQLERCISQVRVRIPHLKTPT